MTTFELLNRNPIAYESAAHHEDNIIHRISWVPETHKLYNYLWSAPQRCAIAALTGQHLGVHLDRCKVQKPKTWMRGSFNVCVPVHVVDVAGNVMRKVLMRCPMGHKLAEDRYPGTADEKLSCEVATYIWMQENCPNLPIPQLLGFGFPNRRHFTHARYRPFYIRWVRAIWRNICALFRVPIPSHYVRNPSAHFIKTGYILLDYVEPTTGQMLSVTWNEHREDAAKRRNIFRGISRLIISVARIPQRRIGSFKFQDDGTITLTNRPLTCGMMILENDGAPRVIEKEETYTCIEPYVSDLLTLHEGRFLAQPNAVNHERDCHFQMAVQALLRTISHHYYDRGMRYGPFVMQFTDLHASNLLVDSDWNITSIIDLEWICARPAEMLDVPYWITGLGIDEVGEEEHSEEYAQTREEFMAIFEDEEQRLALNYRSALRISEIMRRTCESGGSWFGHCLDSVNGMFALFDQHLRPRFISFYLSERMEVLLSRFWTGDSEEVVM